MVYVDPPLTLTNVWLVELSAHIGRAIECRGSLAAHRKQIDTLIIRSLISIRVPYSRLHFFTGVTQILQERNIDIIGLKREFCSFKCKDLYANCAFGGF
jgi:hypothetical protein